jgi:hypothetical protein
MIKRIKDKWGIENNFQFIIILIVFAVTGSVSAKISGPIAQYFELDSFHFLVYCGRSAASSGAAGSG